MANEIPNAVRKFGRKPNSTQKHVLVSEFDYEWDESTGQLNNVQAALMKIKAEDRVEEFITFVMEKM